MTGPSVPRPSSEPLRVLVTVRRRLAQLDGDAAFTAIVTSPDALTRAWSVSTSCKVQRSLGHE